MWGLVRSGGGAFGNSLIFNKTFMSHHTHRARLLPVHHLRALPRHVLSISWGRGHRAKGEAEKFAMVTKAKQCCEREAEALFSDYKTQTARENRETSAKNRVSKN